MNEIGKLAKMLDDAGIEYVKVSESFDVGLLKWNQIKIIDSDGKPILSAICNFGSYGFNYGLIECWDFGKDDPVGFIDASQAYDYFIKHGALDVE